MKIAALVVTTPFIANVCKIPTEAEELCNNIVTSAPTRIPKIGLFPSTRNASEKIGESVKGAIELDINSSPINKREMPIKISPIKIFFCFLQNKSISAPIPINKGA